MSAEVTRDTNGYVSYEQQGVIHSVRVYPNGLMDGWLFEVEAQGHVAIGNVPQDEAETLARMLLAGPSGKPQTATQEAPQPSRTVRVRLDATSLSARPYRGRTGILLASSFTEAFVHFTGDTHPVWLPANAIVEV